MIMSDSGSPKEQSTRKKNEDSRARHVEISERSEDSRAHGSQGSPKEDEDAYLTADERPEETLPRVLLFLFFRFFCSDVFLVNNLRVQLTCY